MNKNDKNNKLDTLSKVLLLIIVLSFVFSAVALGRSCSVNTAVADSSDTPYLSDYQVDLTYSVPDYYDFDDISQKVAFTYNSIDIEKLYAWCGTNIDIYFAQSSWEISIDIVPVIDGTNGGTSMIIYATDIDNFNGYIFDGAYHNCIGGYPVFSVGDILSVLYGLGNSVNVGSTMTVYQSYESSQPFKEGLYFVDYSEPVSFESPDNLNVYTLFNGATVTYTLTWVNDIHSYYQVTFPLSVALSSSRVDFLGLYNYILQNAPYIFDYQQFVNGQNQVAEESLYINFAYDGFIDLSLLTLNNFPYLEGRSDIANGSYDCSFTYRGSDDLLIGVDLTRSAGGLLSYVNGGYVPLGYRFENCVALSIGSFGVYASSTGMLLRDYLAEMSISYADNYGIGYAKGFSDAAIAYSFNREATYNEGKNYGFNQGVASANEYSFLGLIGAVVDAPIQAVTGLLNFEFLGINLFAFFTGLLTVALILFIVKKIMGG